nr:MAG: phosphomevalonate kinase [Bacteriophage sp.]
MSINKVTIVGIKGFKGSGKDTVASMINYILHDGITKAKYDTWLLYHKNKFVENDEIIIHFADKLKDDIADFCGIDRKLLDRQDIKEENYYNFKTGIVSTNTKDADRIINNIDEFNYDNLSPLLSLNSNISIKIRVLLQYYGTNVIRNHFWHEAFINYTINKAFDIRNKLGQCIIADARFDNECEAIKQCGGMIIRVDRKLNNNNDNHESEQIKISQDDYVIDNTGSFVGLFYKVLNFVTNYMV